MKDADESIALVAHSGAGAFLPKIGEALGDRLRCYVFADAQLPDRKGLFPTDAEFLELRSSMASSTGRLPKWSKGWGEETMESPVPDHRTRSTLRLNSPSNQLNSLDQLGARASPVLVPAKPTAARSRG
ncbi:MAG: hypothetical protein ABR507_11185, partial [Actinomycetota bacterium]